jgi:hypothetical protein
LLVFLIIVFLGSVDVFGCCFLGLLVFVVMLS